MKPPKWFMSIFVTLVLVLGPNVTGYALPVSERTPQVRDAIVAAVPDVSSADEVSDAHLATITRLNLRAAGISKLKPRDFSGLTALRNLNLYNNELSRLPDRIFEGLTALTTLRLGNNAIDPLPLIVSLRQVSDSEGTFQVVMPTGAPFDIVVPINVTNGSISSGATMITLSKGTTKSDAFTVVPLTDTSPPPIVQIGALPRRLPANHYGYIFARSTACTRTPQVQEAITAAVPGITDCRDVTDAHLKTIQTLDLRNRGISTLRAADFLGLPALKNLYLSGNQLTHLPTGVFSGLPNLESLHLHQNQLSNLPADIFSGLSSLTHLYLYSNQLTGLNVDVFSELPSLAYLLLNNNKLTRLSPNVFRGLSTPMLLFMQGNTADPLSLTVRLEKVGENRFKVIVPAGAPFNITLSLSVTNGNIIGSAENITIAAGNAESAPFTVTRTPGTLDSVTVDIKTVPSLPTLHFGYKVMTSEDLPVEVLPSLNSPPIFTDGATTTRTVAENTVTNANIGTAIAATDKNKDKLTYTLSGTDAATFAVGSATGQIKTKVALDYETKNRYSVTLTASDGKLTDTISVTINVSDVNEAPTFTGGDSTTRKIAENTPAGQNIGAVITATDPDDDTLTYTLGGTNASDFSLNPKTGQIKTKVALNYERKKTYSVTLTVSDGNLTDAITVTINVTDVAERATKQVTEVKTTPNNAPVFTEGSTTSRSVPENTSSGVDIGTAVSATDADGNTLTYTLSGTDANAFTIDKTTGQLRTKAALDYETKTSYTFTVSVSDGNGGSDSISATINVTDVNETPANNAPEFTEGTSVTRSVAENTTSGANIGTAVSATDTDGDMLTYSLGGTDAASFSIDSTTGQLRTNTALDYETKSTYMVLVTVSDGKLTTTIAVTINITDVDELPNKVTEVKDVSANNAPVFTAGSSTSRSVPENSVNERTDPLYGRTQQVQDAIVAAVPGVNSPNQVTAVHLATITHLWLNNKNITSLNTDDFNGLTSLTNLYLKDNSISDISPLKNLTTLTELDLAYNSISDISPLKNLTALTELSLLFNSVSDISPLKDLTKLKTLHLWNNSVSDISALADLTALTSLTLTSNSVSNISALGNLTALTWLNLYSNSVSDISPLKNLTALTALTLTNNSISDISDLEGLTALTWLDLSYNSISDISALADLTALTWLTLTYNSISDISALENLTALTTLALKFNSISDVSALERLTNLTGLTLSNNPISDYEPLRRLKAANPSVSINIDLTNNPPVFSDGDSTTLTVAENTESGTNIGDAVSATDADKHALIYFLGGTDAESFSIVSTSGQIQTKAALDFETKTTYTVTVTVYDGNHGGDRITVTINVTDVQNAAPSVETPPAPPRTTALLSNYPNPFNPETWIPYQLTKPANVTLTIYNMHGVVVRELKLGHQAAGTYRSQSKAAHWDGKNKFGEKVASGVYFYTLTAGDFSGTRKMLIRK